MIPHRGFHRRFFNKRQPQLGGALGDLFSITDPGGQSTSSVASQHVESDSSAGGVAGASTVSTPVSPTPSSTASSTPLSRSSPSSTGSTIPSAASAKPISSTSPTTSTPTNSISTPTTSTLAPTPILSASDTVYASSDGTRVVLITSTLPATSATANPSSTSFLQDPSLEGGIFALIGIVALIIVFVVVTWAVRKRRRNRLERDAAAAITFDPGTTDHYKHEEDPVEKFRLSMSSSGHGYGYGYGLGIGPAHAPRQEYPGSIGYGQYPATGYPVPPIPYQEPSPAVPQPAAQGQEGANLKRKFSDRKPVPRLLPDPAHDPSMTRVSIPLQYTQQ